MQKYSDGQLIVTPPRLNGLRIKQQSFRNLMEPFVWNYILEKDLDEEDDSSIGEEAYNLYVSLQPPHHHT